MNSKWICSLSNGETIDENKNVGDPKRSPWLNLVDYIKEKKLEIRHIRLIINGISYNSPTFNAVGRFDNRGARSFWVGRKQIITYGGSETPSEEYIEMSYSDGAYRNHLIINVYSNETWQSVSNLGEGQDLFIKQYVGEDW